MNEEDIKSFTESYWNKKMDKYEWESYVKDEEYWCQTENIYKTVPKSKKMSWHLQHKDSVNAEGYTSHKVSFTWDEGIMLVYHTNTKATYTMSKKDARKEWDSLVSQGYRPV